MNISTQIAIGYVLPRPADFTPAFRAFLMTSPNVWERFKAIADEVWARGRRHYSARTIIEVMRHETLIRQADSEFKINNNMAPQMARLYRVMNPDRASLFELREKQEA